MKALPLLLLSFVLAAPVVMAGPEPPIAWGADKADTWHGFKRHHFTVEGCRAWVVEPAQALPGNPWSWCLEFPDAFTERCAAPALLAKGFHHVHIAVGNTFGAPAALQRFSAFYEVLTSRGLARKAALIGLSRGGLYAYRWASENPDKVAAIYGDAPVCDFKSWPGGRGRGKGSPADWTALLQCYGFKGDAEALAYPGNPVDVLAKLAGAGISLIHVVGDADDVVPVSENTAIVEERYRKLGGEIQVIHKPGVGHHPHGLEDPGPVVRFILEKTRAPAPPKRYAWITGLKPEKAASYRQLHANPWPGVNRMLKECHIQNFSIHEREIDGKLYLFAYLEYTGADFEADMKRMAADPETQRWWKETDPCQSPLPDAAARGKIWADMKELYHLP